MLEWRRTRESGVGTPLREERHELSCMETVTRVLDGSGQWREEIL